MKHVIIGYRSRLGCRSIIPARDPVLDFIGNWCYYPALFQGEMRDRSKPRN
jgi:hypothetical protein